MFDVVTSVLFQIKEFHVMLVDKQDHDLVHNGSLNATTALHFRNHVI